MTKTATWNGVVIAVSDETIVVEGNHYFPPSSIADGVLTKTTHSTHCPWKGDASYYLIAVDGKEITKAAWTYETPKDEAAEIKNYVAFYPTVTIE